MKTKTFFNLIYYILGLSTLLILSNCERLTSPDIDESNSRIMKQSIDTNFINDEDFIKLWDITVDLWTRISNHSIDSVCAAASINDSASVIAFFDYNAVEFNELLDTIESVTNRLVVKYPELEEMADSNDCQCGAPGHSELDLTRICNYLRYLEENGYNQDMGAYFDNLFHVAQIQPDLPKWVTCLALCMYQCMPLAEFPPAYFLCLAACESLCLYITD